MKRVGSVHLSSGRRRIGQTFFRRGQDRSNVLHEQAELVNPLQEQMEWVKHSVGVGGISQDFCWGGAEELVLLQEQMGLIQLCTGGYGINQTFCSSRWDRSNFLQEWVGLVRLFAVAGRTGQTFLRSVCD